MQSGREEAATPTYDMDDDESSDEYEDSDNEVLDGVRELATSGYDPDTDYDGKLFHYLVLLYVCQ